MASEGCLGMDSEIPGFSWYSYWPVVDSVSLPARYSAESRKERRIKRPSDLTLQLQRLCHQRKAAQRMLVALKIAPATAGARPIRGVSPAPAGGTSLRSINSTSILGRSRKRGTR